MKRIIPLLIALAIASLCLLGVSASPSLLVDRADLLDDAEERALRLELETFSEQFRFDLVIVTVPDMGGKSPRDFADDFFDDGGYGRGEGRDGALLLISMERSDWYLSTSGYGITAFTDAGIERLGELIVPDLSDGDFDEAFSLFVTLCRDYLTRAAEGEPYDVGDLPKGPFDFGGAIVIALFVGLLIGLITALVLKAQLKTVRPRHEASEYLRKDSFVLSASRDFFLYRTVNRVRRQSESSSGGSRTHTSSSGRSHGGGGGRF